MCVCFVQGGKSVCDVMSELANLHVMFCQRWQIYVDVLSREADMCGCFVQVDKSVYNVLSGLANLYVMFCQGWQICM